MIDITQSVKAINGIGDKKAALLEKLGIKTVEDLLRFFPRAYQDRGNTKTLLEAQMSKDLCSMTVTVAGAVRSATLKNRMSVVKFPVFDESGRCTVIFFNRPYISRDIETGDILRLFGRVTSRRSGSEIVSPDYEKISTAKPLADIYPVYPLTKGLNQKNLRSIMGAAISLASGSFPSLIPESIERRYSIMSAEDAFRAIHSPRAFASIEKARERFVFEELFSFALAVNSLKKDARKKSAPPLRITRESFSLFTDCLPFELTGAQKRVINEIASDMSKPYSMHRLVTGDVGCGKTVCAAAAAYIALASGKQAMLMAPTEILARQHYEDLSDIFERLGYRTALLTGNLKASEKNKIKKDIALGNIRFVIGTHALISDSVEFESAAIAICDEQHRFGVNQRAKLGGKSSAMHVLVMSATPIPRTLALAIHGDLDISSVDEMPPGRQKVKTYRVNEGYRERLNAFIEKQVSMGYGVYIVCPSIEKNEDDEEMSSLVDITGRGLPELKDAVSYTENLRNSLPDVAIGYVHGRMASAERDKTMTAFQNGELSVLVSTTVIEVGVNVPRATLMIVENAERFGLSQLHQLRGRVGRGSVQSYCVLVSDAEGDNANSRLSALCESSDGYKIAEKDLEIRGPGDLFAMSGVSMRQSGDAGFRLASLGSDMEIFRKAFSAASEYLQNADENDPVVKRVSALIMNQRETVS